MCGKLKTISVEVRSGNGTTRYTYQTRKWPKVSDTNNDTNVQETLDTFYPRRTLERIFCGNLSLCAMQKHENRAIWKLIFDRIEEEVELQD